jgi:hypothetical protein
MYDHHCFVTYDDDPLYRIRRICRDGEYTHIHLHHHRVPGCYVTVNMQWSSDKLRDYCNRAYDMTQTAARQVEQYLAEPRFSR